jgi:hypothetical protein
MPIRILPWVTLISGLSISGIAGYYSIIGLTAIFAAAFWPVVVMGTALEVGKLVSLSWLYNNWAIAPFLTKTYFIFAIVVLMFITSMGIFGFLSKAHIDQTLIGSNVEIEVAGVQSKIDRETTRIVFNKTVLDQLDAAVNSLTEANRIRGSSGAIAVRKDQQEQRDALQSEIDVSLDKIQVFNVEMSVLDIEQTKLAAEVGPIKFVAELVYGESSKEVIEKSIIYVIVILIFVFDPLAVLLILAFNIGEKNKNNVNKSLTNNAIDSILTINDEFINEGRRNVTERKINKKQHYKPN